MYVSICMHNMDAFTSARVRMIYACIHALICIYVCISEYTYVYTHIYVYTYIHTYLRYVQKCDIVCMCIAIRMFVLTSVILYERVPVKVGNSHLAPGHLKELNSV